LPFSTEDSCRQASQTKTPIGPNNLQDPCPTPNPHIPLQLQQVPETKNPLAPIGPRGSSGGIVLTQSPASTAPSQEVKVTITCSDKRQLLALDKVLLMPRLAQQ
ncbi:hypothetical protein A6R68_11709, partial [Neotoma lepida]